MTEASPAAGRLRGALHSRRDAIVAAWQKALSESGYAAQSARLVRDRLAACADRIVAALAGDEDPAVVGAQVGDTLADLHYVQPDDLGATLRALAGASLAGFDGASIAVISDRLGPLLSAVGARFAGRARAILLEEQEAIRGALLAEREQAAAALAAHYAEAERARSELRATLDASSDGIMLVNPERRAIMVNRRYEELLAIPATDAVGRTLAELADVLRTRFADSATIENLGAILADRDSAVSYDLRLTFPEARELAFFSTPVRGANGAYLGRLHTFRDVTQEREVDRMKSQFVSLVSHELRTPLTSIKGYVDLLVSGEVGPLASEQMEFLRIVQQNADREVALITDLLDLSRMESGKLALDRQALALPRVLEQVAVAFRPQFAEKGQRIVLDVPPDLPTLWGDGKRLMQIFTNLVSNAHKYTPQGGVITVRATLERNQVVVEVHDTGIGLSPEEQTQLFTRFYRAKNQATVAVGGTGLGLAITRQLVELHGGTIGVQSAVGEGSTFRVALPITSATETEAPPIGRPQILVIEDEPAIAALLREYLERGGYEVLLAPTGADALRLAQVARPALVTLDIGLPDVDGFTVLEWLKQQPTTAAIPVLILSATEDRERGTLLGSVDYLVKPVSQDTLLSHVRTHLSPDASPLVLIADDEADVRSVLGATLQRAGYRVLDAADGAAAVRLAFQKQPALLLMDVRMPGTDGLSALRQLRDEAVTRSLPVIMLTASPGAREESWALTTELAINQVLQKPCPADVLVGVIADIIGPADPRSG